MTRPELTKLIKPVVELAIKAGDAILKVYETDFSVTHKDDQSPLTEADLAANNIIHDGLSMLTPHVPQLSEESTEVPFNERRKWQTYWLIDPLDGTREFVKRNGEFTVNIALIENHRPVLGVVHAPVLGDTYSAYLGGGAFYRTGTLPAQPIRVRSCLENCKIVAGSRSHRGASLDAFLSRIGDYQLVPMGSSLKACLVAAGKADIYPRFGPTSEWDTAAAQCIVEQAGGSLTNTSFEPLRYNTKESLLNPDFIVTGDVHYNWQRYLG